jgi:hypothetical protein
LAALLAAAHFSSTSRSNFVPEGGSQVVQISFAVLKIFNEFLEPLLSSNGLPQRHNLQAKIKKIRVVII